MIAGLVEGSGGGDWLVIRGCGFGGERGGAWRACKFRGIGAMGGWDGRGGATNGEIPAKWVATGAVACDGGGLKRGGSRINHGGRGLMADWWRCGGVRERAGVRDFRTRLVKETARAIGRRW
jgi:hypothetical protein